MRLINASIIGFACIYVIARWIFTRNFGEAVSSALLLALFLFIATKKNRIDSFSDLWRIAQQPSTVLMILVAAISVGVLSYFFHRVSFVVSLLDMVFALSFYWVFVTLVFRHPK